MACPSGGTGATFLIPPTPPLVPPESRFEIDLQAVRAARGLSLAQIQQETRIPVDVLRRFEDGDLIGDPTYNEVYLKAFLKSYAKAVGVAPADVLGAYNQHQSGNYQGTLHPNYKPSSPPAETAPAPTTEAPQTIEKEPAPPAPAVSSKAPGPVSAVRESAPGKARPAAQISAKRVSRPSVPSARHSYDKNWGLIIGLFVGAVAVLGAILWFLVFDGGSPNEEGGSEDPTIAEVDSAGAAIQPTTGTKRLQIPIQVTVTAGGNGLQDFRVTQAPNERIGTWIEVGESMTFESDSLIVLWGENADGIGPEATLELQGERWTPTPGTILRIDRENGQRLLDSLTTAAPAPQTPPADGA